MPKKQSRKGGNRPPTQRQLRIGETIRANLAEVFIRGNIQDPVLQKMHVTVSEVRCAYDLRQAICFVAPLGGGDNKEMLEALNRVKGYLKAQVARKMTLKFMPDLVFKADTSFEYAASVDTILHSATVSRDLGERAEDEEDEPVAREKFVRKTKEDHLDDEWDAEHGVDASDADEDDQA